MKHTLTSIALATLFAGICMLASTTVMAQAEQAAQPSTVEGVDNLAAITCPDAQKFAFGSGASRFSFCVTTNGTIQNLESPATYKHITNGEGYIACGAGFNGSWAEGSDQSQADWAKLVAVSQPGGPHTLPLTIIRQSEDGRFQLKQVFDWDATQKIIFITMTLKNISGAPITGVRLARYFDGNIDNVWPNIYDNSSDSVWGRNASAGERHGLMLSALSLAQPHIASIEQEIHWPIAKTICFTSGLSALPHDSDDYVGRLTYELGTLQPEQLKTVKMLYKRF